jgi:hypothetical protein
MIMRGRWTRSREPTLDTPAKKLRAVRTAGAGFELRSPPMPDSSEPVKSGYRKGRRRAKKPTKLTRAVRAKLKEEADTRIGLKVKSGPAKVIRSNRYDINEYRGGPAYIRDVGTIKRRRG